MPEYKLGARNDAHQNWKKSPEKYKNAIGMHAMGSYPGVDDITFASQKAL